MFTGIIQDLGELISLRDGKLVINVGKSASARRPGESLAVSGVCLTIVEVSPPRLTMDILEETLRRTNLGELKPGDAVNLEPALKLDEELGGHFVTGHIDGRGELISRRKNGHDWIMKIALPAELKAYVVEKGSIALEGVSLTIAEISENVISVHIIPYTLSHTNLGEKPEGSRLNVETDLLGKYVVRYLEKTNAPARPLDKTFLEETGII
ncbi:MAG: riboflavin synthase [Candidatus Euphemobacter frigidus]|nr:riboflavin synthase [Candidatus Euphemobacter frigidus]MDP8275090.1 riboflavin synthase [Candidatus Euphemobacter frigidus]